MITVVRPLKIGMIAVIATVASVGVLIIISLELAYRLALHEVGPLPILNRPPALPIRAATVLWAAEAHKAPTSIPKIYPWNVYQYFSDDHRSLIFAWGVARNALVHAKERGQVHGNLDWHLKGMALTAWITRNLSTDEILASYAGSLNMGKYGRGLDQAAQRLFGSDLVTLHDAELALLIGIAASPVRYCPIRNPRRALERRNYVLQLIVEAGGLAASALPVAQSSPIRVQIPRN